MLEYFLSFLILTGAIFTFIGSLGLVRLKDLFTRLHGPTKATTLGVGSLLIASAIFFSTGDAGISLHEVLITLFLFITAPVSAHLLSKAALHLGLNSLAQIPEEPGEKEETEEKVQTEDGAASGHHAAVVKTETPEPESTTQPASSDVSMPNKTQ